MKKVLFAAALWVLGSAAVFAQHAAVQPNKSAAVKAADAKVESVRRSMDSTVTTNVYGMQETDKYGTMDYGVASTTVNGQNQGDVMYATYDPSRSAVANSYDMEVSLTYGGSYSTNKAEGGDKYAKMGQAMGANILWNPCPYMGIGIDYMFLNPDGRHYGSGADRVSFHRFRAHNIALAGKLNLNAWSNWRVYIPFGAGMMNARLKTDATGASTSKDKWGASLYAGLGVQYDITSTLFAGLEYRYTYAFISDKHLSDFNKDKNLQFHNVFFRMGMRF